MPVDGRTLPSPLGCLSLEPLGAEDVVHMVVGVDGRCEAGVRSPGADVLEDDVAVEQTAGVEQDQPVAGVERGDARHALQVEDAVGDLLGGPPFDGCSGVLDPDEVGLAGPVPLGHVSDRAHRSPFVGVGLGRINWALAALCLSFLPVLGERSANIAWRMLGTLVGAVLATILAVALPDNVDLALAGVAAVLTVAYALMPEPSARVPYFTFLTTTVLLLYGAGKFGPVAHLAVVRVLMTVIGVGLAAVLSLVLVRLVPRPPAPASPTPPG